MELTEIMGMAIGERKSLRANGRYKVGGLVFDDNPYHNEVLRVLEVSRPIVWGSDRIDDEDEFGRRAGEVTTDIVVERVERSHEGQAVVDAFWARYRKPVKIVAGELRINACRRDDGWFRESGEVRPLARQRRPLATLLSALRTDSVSGFSGDQEDRVYSLPADGWYEACAMRSPTTSEGYFFRIADGSIAELIPHDSIASLAGVHWTMAFEAKNSFRDEHGS